MGIVEYLTILIVSFISSATVIIPVPGFVVLPIFTHLDPIAVAIVGAFGSSLGEIIGYGVGKGGLSLYKRKHKIPKWFLNIEKYVKKNFYGIKSSLIIIVFAATPLPFDFIGLFAGAIGYDIKKFFISSFIGKFILYLSLVYGFTFFSMALFSIS